MGLIIYRIAQSSVIPIWLMYFSSCISMEPFSSLDALICTHYTSVTLFMKYYQTDIRKGCNGQRYILYHIQLGHSVSPSFIDYIRRIHSVYFIPSFSRLEGNMMSIMSIILSISHKRTQPIIFCDIYVL